MDGDNRRKYMRKENVRKKKANYEKKIKKMVTCKKVQQWAREG